MTESTPSRRSLLGAAGIALAATGCLVVAPQNKDKGASPDGSAAAGGSTAEPRRRAAAAGDGGAQPGRTPNTRFAVNAEMWFRDLPFAERIDAAADLGFPAVEFWNTEGKDLSAIASRSAAREVEISQFTAWGFAPGLNDARNHDAFEKRIRESCDIADQLSARKATVVAGNDIVGMEQEEMLDNVRAGLQRVAPIVEDRGLMLILEPMNIRVDHKGHCLYGSADALRICREINSPMVKINWDLYHMQIEEGDLTGHLKEGIDQVGYVQLADHPGRNEPGTGEVNYARVLSELKRLRYTDFVGLECWPTDDIAAARAVFRADSW